MRALLALFVLLALKSGSLADEIRKGATMQVAPNSIWFQDNAQLTHWQALKKKGDAAALASFQEKVLGSRDAWQFIHPMNVKVLGYVPRENRVKVEMKTEGRMLGTIWVLDAHAITQ